MNFESKVASELKNYDRGLIGAGFLFERIAMIVNERQIALNTNLASKIVEVISQRPGSWKNALEEYPHLKHLLPDRDDESRDL